MEPSGAGPRSWAWAARRDGCRVCVGRRGERADGARTRLPAAPHGAPALNGGGVARRGGTRRAGGSGEGSRRRHSSWRLARGRSAAGWRRVQGEAGARAPRLLLLLLVPLLWAGVRAGPDEDLSPRNKSPSPPQPAAVQGPEPPGEDPYGVAVGGTVGHCLCTGLAVIGGRMIAQKISVRTVTIIGGIVFLAFAFSALFISPDSGF
uniref:GDT1 family protein n=1 Tax=Microcebus murinus TaxID=30608 RepID=A0A8C5YAK3_MICMU